MDFSIQIFILPGAGATVMKMNHNRFKPASFVYKISEHLNSTCTWYNANLDGKLILLVILLVAFVLVTKTMKNLIPQVFFFSC